MRKCLSVCQNSSPLIVTHLLSVSRVILPCWGQAPWISKLPSRAPAAAPTADLGPVFTLEEPARAPTAAPRAAAPVLSHDGVKSAWSCNTWLSSSLYGPRITITVSNKLCHHPHIQQIQCMVSGSTAWQYIVIKYQYVFKQIKQHWNCHDIVWLAIDICTMNI